MNVLNVRWCVLDVDEGSFPSRENAWIINCEEGGFQWQIGSICYFGRGRIQKSNLNKIKYLNEE